MNGRPHRLRGFTIVELLAVIAVIGLLVTLLIPAVQMARESARRARCISNLHQLGVAFHSYHEQYGQLPPAYVAVQESKLPTFLGVKGFKDDANIHTYGEMLLPFLDQGPLYERIDFTQPHFAPVDLASIGLPNYTANNQDVVATSLPVFLCPSAPRPENPHSYTWSEVASTEPPIEVPLSFSITYRNGGNDYGPSNGVGYPTGFAPAQEGNPQGEGILSNNHPSARFSMVSDGTSQTALMWEIAGRPQLWQRGTRVDGATTGGGGWADVQNAENWFAGTSDDGSTRNGPCVINCSNMHAGGTYSFHPGGVHVLLCDGAARLLNQNTNVGVFVQIVTYHGNTSVDEF